MSLSRLTYKEHYAKSDMSRETVLTQQIKSYKLQVQCCMFSQELQLISRMSRVTSYDWLRLAK